MSWSAKDAASTSVSTYHTLLVSRYGARPVSRQCGERRKTSPRNWKPNGKGTVRPKSPSGRIEMAKHKCAPESPVTILCPKCLQAKPRSVHHILPQRYYKGVGPTLDLCRRCHDELEKLIPFEEKSKSFYYRVVREFLR